MEKEKAMIIFAALFLLMGMNANTVRSYNYNITNSCDGNVCVEGQDSLWQINLWNDGNHDIEFVAIEMMDAVNNTQIAGLKIPFNPQSDNRGNLIMVKQGRSVHVNITGKVPKANARETEIYYMCFTTAIYDFYIIARDNTYTSRQCFSLNETMTVLKCIQSEHCHPNQYCIYSKCKNLNCTPCQHIVNHTCVNFECCGSEQCGMDSTCANNTCRPLECMFNEHFYNHTCNSLNCATEEQIINNTCKKLDCAFGEYAFNHTCKKLECRQSEFIMNHTCNLLNCNDDEYAKDHLCLPLECSENETVSNHKCMPLKCHFFQDLSSHKCINNRPVIMKLLMEIIAVIVIISFLLLDFSKLNKMHSEEKK